MQLRDYQNSTIEGVFEWWGDPSKRGQHPLVVLPTGAGKTIVFSELIRRLISEFSGVRVLILAHRKELIGQAEDKILKVWPMAPVAVWCAGMNRKEIGTVTVASRDSIRSNPQALGKFDVIIIDEAHNISEKQETAYQRIIASFKQLNPSLTVIGFTATPFRTGSGLIYGDDRLFSGLAYRRSIKEMIDEGYLCRPVSKRLSTEIDTDGLRTVAGDFAKKALNERTENSDLVSACIDEWQTRAIGAGRQSTLFFCSSIPHAQMTATEIRTRGHACAVIHANTPKLEREAIMARFSAGLIPALANVGVLTEGTDIPCIDCIALMRPTKSLTLFIQMVGRGLRLSPETGKRDCLLLDFGGNLQRFGPIDTAAPALKRGQDKRTKDCPECGAIVGLFKRKCTECPHEFMKQPVKDCHKCGEENSPSAAVCIACGEVFEPDLSYEAANDAVLSDDLGPRLQSFDVTAVNTSVSISKQTGNPYLRMTFVCGLLNRFNKNFFLGYPGTAGKRALRELEKIADWAYEDLDPYTAHGLHQRGELLSAPIQAIQVDTHAKWQDVISIYQEKPQEVA